MNIQLVLFRLYRYVRYWLLSVDEHSLQSPFAFKVYTQCLKTGAGPTKENSALEVRRKQLCQSSRRIGRPTQGATSSLSGRKSKKLSEIIKHGISDFDTSRILANLIAYSQAKTVLELGTSVGLNTIYLSKVEGVKEVVTIEADPELCVLAVDNFNLLRTNNVTLLNNEIGFSLSSFEENNRKFDFIYVDANHTFEATVEYFLRLKLLCSENAIIVFDDISWSVGMRDAWEVIKSELKTGLTIENADMGIVFKRPLENRMNYIARF